MLYKLFFIAKSVLISIICKYFPSTKIQYPNNSTSIINISLDKKYVTKEVILYNKYNVINNEIKWLEKLHNVDFTPNYFSRSDNIITLTYAGENINKNNVPENWEKQIDNISKLLKEENCSHNDIKPSDILILKGKIMLIDFQWATNINEPIPKHWPKYIGRNYKTTNGTYNDAISLKKSILSIINSK